MDEQQSQVSDDTTPTIPDTANTPETAQIGTPTKPLPVTAPEGAEAATEPQTAQMVGNEPLGEAATPEVVPVSSGVVTEPLPSESVAEATVATKVPSPQPSPFQGEGAEATAGTDPEPTPPSASSSSGTAQGSEGPSAGEIAPTPAPPLPPPTIRDRVRDFLAKANATLLLRRTKKQLKIMELLAKKGRITNDDVEKFLHVSDATATRYLSKLEKSGLIKQTGRSGRSVFYTKV